MHWIKVTPYKQTLKLGKYTVGSYFRDGAQPHGDKNKYRVICNLPGIIKDLGCYPNEYEAQQCLEKAVNHWIKNSEILE